MDDPTTADPDRERLAEIEARFTARRTISMSLTRAVCAMRSTIEQRRRDGWTWHDIAEVFRQAGYAHANAQNVRQALAAPAPKTPRAKRDPKLRLPQPQPPRPPDAPSPVASRPSSDPPADVQPRLIRPKTSRL